MGTATLVFLLAILALAMHRMLYERRRGWRPPLWKNIRALRNARGSGWADVNEDLNRLFYDQFVERQEKRAQFWRAVAEAERQRSHPPGRSGRTA